MLRSSTGFLAAALGFAACRSPQEAPPPPPSPAAVAAPAPAPAPATAAVAREATPAPRVLVPDFGKRAERDRDYDLRHLRFEVDFDLDRRRIAARTTNQLSPIADGLREVPLDAEALVARRATVNGREAEFRTEPERIVVRLDRAYREGEEIEVALDYEAEPVRGLHWVGPEPGYPEKPRQVWSQGQAENHHAWLPTYDFPNDKATWEAILTCPEDLTAVSNGVLVEERAGPRPGTRTFHWRMDQPNSTYLIAVAVGPFERYADDFRGKPVEYWLNRGVGEETARRSFGQTPDMLVFFSDRIGLEYPWPRYAQVAVSEFVVGGMENVSCTLQTDRTLHDARAHLDADSEGLVAHELAHQWWGDLLTCRDWSHVWLNEGFATFFQALYVEHAHGTDAYRVEIRRNQESFRRADSRENPRPIVEEFFSRESDRGSNHVYTKGASVLHMLRFVLGEDRFWKAIALYAREHAGRNVDTHDFRRAVAEATGRNLEWFFEQWVFLAGYPEFEVEASWDEEAKTETVVVRQAQKAGGLVPYFRTPVDLKFVVDGEKRIERIWVFEREHRFHFPLPARPQLVRFDEGGSILKTLRFDKPIEEWIFQLERDDDVIGRIEAVEALGELALDPRAGEALARKVASDDYRAVRTEAAEALGKRKDAVAKGALLAALADGEARVRAAAAQALQNFEKDDEVASALRRTMETDESYRTRANAVRSLAKVAGPSAFETVAAALEIPSHQGQVASAAIAALAELDAARALALLLEEAAYGKPYDTRIDAIDALARIAPKVSNDDRARIIATVEKGLDDRFFRARTAAIRALGRLGDPSVRPRLATIAKSDRDSRSKNAAEQALRRLDEERVAAPASPPAEPATPVPASAGRREGR